MEPNTAASVMLQFSYVATRDGKHIQPFAANSNSTNLQLFAKFAAICKILTKNRDSCVNKNLPQCFCLKCLKKVPNITTLLDMLVKKNKYKWFLLGWLSFFRKLKPLQKVKGHVLLQNHNDSDELFNFHTSFFNY